MTKTRSNSYSKTMTAFIGSRSCFVAIIAIFVLEAAWIALSGRYPMAFDENFHLGVIRLYSHHLGPFWQAQPSGADAFGAVFRDPSYLYHYLMSFPYRLISLLTHDQTIQVLWLRFINIGLFALALPLYKRLLLKTGASRTIVHACLAIFILIPIAPLLAAQINYDNLIFPLVGLILLMTAKASTELTQRKRSNPYTLGGILALCLLGSLVKYAFLPIFAAIILFLAAIHWQAFGSFKNIWASKKAAFRRIGAGMALLLAGVILLASGLFVERYGINLVRYHKPVPDCAEVLSVQQCTVYGPWIRDHNLETHKPATATSNPLTFTADWFYGMWLRSFFAVDGPSSNYATRGPLILPGIGAIVLASLALAATLVNLKRIFRSYNRQVLWLFIVVMAGYVGVLWLDGYQSFLQTGQAVAINGRYLLLIMPLLLLLLALGVNELFRRRQAAKLAFAGLALLCMLWGGGTLTYILRSDNSWYWPNQTIYDANRTVRNALGPVTPGYYNPTEFMGRN